MTLKAILTSDEHGKLDEGIQSAYTETQDGAWVLDAEGLGEHPSMRGLVRTLDQYKELGTDARKLRSRLEEADRLREQWGGFEVDDVRSKLERLEEMEEGKGVDVEAERKKARDAQKAADQKEIDRLAEDLEDRDAFIQRLVIDNRLDSALAHVKVIEAYRPAVKALMKDRRWKVVRENGDYKGVFETDLGEIEVSNYVEQWSRADDAKPYLPASDTTGSGAGGGGGGGGGRRNNPWKSDSWNLTEQGRIAKENVALARQLAAAAGKALAT